ncbi:MAG TPA: SMP-30/gluconolactonase/LRE family protein [Thermoanaerobaculia bacterium]|nr:SMP-30/gluconolactonase/LRE family protein [Thermoanaerobaculia bacterium]
MEQRDRPAFRRRHVPALALAVFTLAALVPGAATAHPPDAPTLETLRLFDPAALETPENIVLDRAGNQYISLALTGEVRKIAPDGTQSTLIQFPIGAPLTFCGPFFNAVTGITIDRQERYLYASVVSCDLGSRGVWRVALRDGSAELLANLPLESLPNGLDLYRGDLYVADSSLSRVWRVPAEGGEAEVWLESPLLAGALVDGQPLPGANGLKVFHGEVYVATSAQGTIVAIPIEPDGSAGEPRIHGVLPAGQGCDDFSFDVHGSLYCATDPSNTVVRLDPDGTTEILLTAADGLDGPTATAFGRTGQDRFNLYITNGAFPFFSTTHRPSLMRLHLGVPGAPPI